MTEPIAAAATLDSAQRKRHTRRLANRMRLFKSPHVAVDSVLVVSLLALYLPTLARGVTFSDGPEIAAAIVNLAVIHPTGYPLFTMLAHLFVRLVPLPIEPCVEIALFNALLGVGAALFVSATVRRWTAHHWPAQGGREASAASDADAAALERRSRLLRAGAGACAGLFIGISPLLWNQVRIPEVYPFHVFLVSWSIYRWTLYETRGRRALDILWTAVPMGLGLAHHVTIVYMLPAALVYIALTRPKFLFGWVLWPWVWLMGRLGRGRSRLARYVDEPAWVFLASCALGALPLLSYLYLIWANRNTTGIPWGGVNDWDSLYNHVTGAQYRHYMKGFGFKSLGKRALELGPDYYSVLFFPGAALTALGLLAAARRAWRWVLFLMVYATSTVLHGLQYGVGDYKNYFLPAYLVCSVFFGLGLAWALLLLDRAGRGLPRLWHAAWIGALALSAVLLVLDVGTFPVHFEKKLGSAALVLAAVFGLAAIAWACPPFLPRFSKARVRGAAYGLLGFVALLGLAVGSVRGAGLAKRPLVGQKHAASVADELPPGAIYMTLGDGFIFSQWYQQHALGDGIDSAVVNVRRMNGGWYLRFLKTRFPEVCDPLYGEYGKDPSAYAEHCDSFEKRQLLQSKRSWVLPAPDDFRAGKRVTVPAPAHGEALPVAASAAHPRCSEAPFRKKQPAKCRCWGTNQKRQKVDEWCVPSLQENAIVLRSAEEIYAHRLIQDHIDSRPVFERNVFTRWVGGKNARKWDGPAYQRPDRRYTLVNRGRSNQIMYTADLEGQDACGQTRLQRFEQPELSPPRPRPLSALDRPKFEPSDWPILLAQSYLAAHPKHNSDRARLDFEPGQDVHVNVQWFEAWHYAEGRPKGRGERLIHGVRACAFDPSGERIWTGSAKSGLKHGPAFELPLPKDAAAGVYVLQACSVGPVERGEDFSERPCVRGILEYEFQVEGDAPAPAQSARADARR